jgi:hypothetical protein
MLVTLAAGLSHPAAAVRARSRRRAEGLEHLNPTIIGVLTVICAVVLFCGSAYRCSARTWAPPGFLVSPPGSPGSRCCSRPCGGRRGAAASTRRTVVRLWRAVDVVDTLADRRSRQCATSRRTTDPCRQAHKPRPRRRGDRAGTAADGRTAYSAAVATLGFSSSTQYLVDAVNLRPYEEGGERRTSSGTSTSTPRWSCKPRKSTCRRSAIRCRHEVPSS